MRRDPVRYTIRFRRGRTIDTSQIGSESRRFVQERSDHQRYVAQYNLQVYEAKGSETGSNVRAAVRTLNDESDVEFASPVFRRSERPDDAVYVLNRFIVEFRDGVDEAAARSFLTPLNDEHGVRIVERLQYIASRVGFLLETPAGDGPRGPVQLAQTYYEEGNAGTPKLVRYAIPDLVQLRDFKAVPSAVRADIAWQYSAEQWHLDKAYVTSAWALTEGSPDIIIAIADDGVDVDHPEFVGRVVRQFDFAGSVPDARPKSSMDNHGTACAGVAVAGGVHARGVAPRCRIIAARTPDLLGSHDEAVMFQWLADGGAAVISCSWGPPDGTGESYPLPYNVSSALEYCVSNGRGGKGTAIVWAAGNGNESVSLDGWASCPHVIAVAACTDQDARAAYSDFGPEVWICAPSSGATSAGNRRVFTTDRSGAQGYNPGGSAAAGDADGSYTNDFGGTSSAAPLVAGVIGLMLSANPNLTPAQVKDILKNTTDKIGTGYNSQGHSAQFGYGRVNAQRAVAEARRLNGSGGSSATQTSNGTSGTSAPPADIRVSAAPTIHRGGPVFQVQIPAGRFFAFEAATRPDLFSTSTRGANASPAEFYATWQEASQFASTPEYRLPADAWGRLSAAPRVYYRIVTSTQRDRWVDTRASEISSIEILA